MQPLQNRIQRLVGIVHLKFLESSVRCMHTRECGSHFSGRNDAIFGKTVIRKYREQGAEQAWIALVAVSVLEGQEAFAKAPQMPQRLNAHVEEAIVGAALVFEAAMLLGRRVLRVELNLSAERRSGGGGAHVCVSESETQMEGTRLPGRRCRERIFGHGRPGFQKMVRASVASFHRPVSKTSRAVKPFPIFPEFAMSAPARKEYTLVATRHVWTPAEHGNQNKSIGFEQTIIFLLKTFALCHEFLQTNSSSCWPSTDATGSPFNKSWAIRLSVRYDHTVKSTSFGKSFSGMATQCRPRGQRKSPTSPIPSS